jgi:hypothetical protein
VTNSQHADRALAETAAGAVQGGGEQDATEGPRPDVETGESTEDEFDAGEFVLDHDADPPEEVQPTTS